MGVTPFSNNLHAKFLLQGFSKLLILDSNNLLPKLLPQVIKSVDGIQGGGSSGTIEQVNITQDVQFKHVKHRNVEIDQENLVRKWSMIEGVIHWATSLNALLMRSNLRQAVKFVEVQYVSKCLSKGEYEIKEEEIKGRQALSSLVF
ncbi:Bet v I/Major latex protein [Dillenia turbinata]|uniref:Bet v I/Major latex protein n=1 Tax=Dillenia turbinata TaxID=194707 RepID=A0AAN8YV00_9MAGN